MRKHSRSLKVISLLTLLMMIHLSTAELFAADQQKTEKEGVLAGRAFDEYKLEKPREKECPGTVLQIPNEPNYIICQKPIPDLPVRIVNVDTGEGLDTKTDKDGCYIFKKVPLGMYSESASYQGKDYTLPDKIKVESSQKLFACVALKQETTDIRLLFEVNTKDQCKCKQFPFLFLLLGAGGGIAIGVIKKGGENEEASPATPQR